MPRKKRYFGKSSQELTNMKLAITQTQAIEMGMCHFCTIAWDNAGLHKRNKIAIGQISRIFCTEDLDDFVYTLGQELQIKGVDIASLLADFDDVPQRRIVIRWLKACIYMWNKERKEI